MVTLTTGFLENCYPVMLVKWPPKYGRAVECERLILAFRRLFEDPLHLFIDYNQNPDRKVLLRCMFLQIFSVQASRPDP